LKIDWLKKQNGTPKKNYFSWKQYRMD